MSIRTPSGSENPGGIIHKPVTYQCGPKKVTEYSYELPKGKHSNLIGSFSYTQPSAKAGRLKGQLAAQKMKLQKLEAKERTTLTAQPKKKQRLRAKIRYLENELCREVASLPVTHVSVREMEDD